MVSIKRVNYRHFLPDVFIIAFSLYLSLWIRLGWDEFLYYLPIAHKLLGIFLVIRIGTFLALGVYDIIWRYVSVKDAVKLFRAVLFSSVLIVAATYLVDIGRLPRSTFFIDTLLVTLALGAARMGRRLVFEHSAQKLIQKSGKLALIYGASATGRALAQRFETDGQQGLRVIGFLDDDPQKQGRMVGGFKILGSRESLVDVLKAYPIQELMIAEKLQGAHLREVVQVARTYKIRPRMMSEMGTVGSDRRSGQVFREIELSDLLNRPEKKIDYTSIRELIQNKRVLVTGAGGSIGSELARQILGFRPGRLLLLDHSEFNLYQIDQELRLNPEDNSLVIPVLMDIKDSVSLRNLMKEYLPEVVFHAAAYKHVHLVEANPHSSILNNILGTKNLLELSREFEVGTFVLISSDKAVNPAGIMGATKRVCELMVANLGHQAENRYCAVRFGNVLGSSGSLIPLLQKQIQNSEPVTITDKDMTRYFMLIPEAVSLVLKAATIAQAGDINILRMGEPVKIVDIAKSLIALMGKTEEEVPLVFTGLRPGEKMFEELYLCGNELNTEHPDILVLPQGDTSKVNHMDSDFLWASVSRIIQCAQRGEKEAVFELQALVNSIYAKPQQLQSGFVPGEVPLH